MIDLLLATVFLFAALAILGGLLFLLGRLRDRPAASPREPDGGLWGTLFPAALLVMLVGASVAVVSRPAVVAPTLVVKLTGYQFGWKFGYFEALPEAGERRFEADQLRDLGTTTDQLVLPRGVEAVFLATSTDVIHRLEVPELKVRVDLIPGLVSRLAVRPTKTGASWVQSDGLCGVAPEVMSAPLRVVEPAAFEQWLASP